MKTPIPMPVKAVNVRHSAPGDWTADITFGIPEDGSNDDPTLTLNSGEGTLPPKVGDFMLVRPPEIVGYANDKGAATPELPPVVQSRLVGPVSEVKIDPWPSVMLIVREAATVITGAAEYVETHTAPDWKALTAANLMRDHVKNLAWVYAQIEAAHGSATPTEK